MRLGDVLEELEEELRRVKDHNEGWRSDEYREGFVKGLQQAKYVLEAMLARPMI